MTMSLCGLTWNHLSRSRYVPQWRSRLIVNVTREEWVCRLKAACMFNRAFGVERITRIWQSLGVGFETCKQLKATRAGDVEAEPDLLWKPAGREEG